MPELPEVHTTATMLNKLLPDLRICDVWTNYNSPHHKGKDNIKDPAFFRKFKKLVVGAKFQKMHRRGKNVLLKLDNGQTIIVHMKMTGHLLYGKYKRNSKPKTLSSRVWEGVEPKELKDPFNQHIRFVINLSNGKSLALSDMRKFAKVTIVLTETAHTSSHLKGIGPEPLAKSFDFAHFKERLGTRPNGKIKQVLMDPKIIAGIGNIYSDEILFASGLHPMSATGKVPEKILQKIFSGMKVILAKGIDFGGDSMSDYRNPLGVRGQFQYHHKAYRKTGKPCSKKNCRGKIEKVRLGGRHAHFCNIHQHKYI